MNQFSLSSASYGVGKLAILAQALITLDLTSVLSHHFCQVLITMLQEPKQVPK
jgi:hypothetical protein